ncbi:MAG: thioredoxin domain-containing protein [Candidatus Omnitrophica bacterium]|nr:thioredoxin domain-containing protein [Candidatus Omnitrophota bacterium]
MKINKWLLTALVSVMCLLAVKLVKGTYRQAHPQPAPMQAGDRIKGKPDAGLRISEFTDFQCPACGKVLPVLDELLERYAGKISIQHKYFPLPNHKHSVRAASYAECANAQGKFWSYHDLLFSRQPDWSGLDDPSQYFDDLAMKVSLDMDRLRACLAGTEASGRVNSDKLDGEIAGVKATPTFVVDGKLFVGGDNLKAELESRLGK